MGERSSLSRKRILQGSTGTLQGAREGKPTYDGSDYRGLVRFLQKLQALLLRLYIYFIYLVIYFGFVIWESRVEG